jgi:DNA (cytosine-5)-methyltransferase 1
VWKPRDTGPITSDGTPVTRPKLLDLAGFEVTGIDVHQRMHLPEGVEFIRADALELLEDQQFLQAFDVLTGSPPCQTHSRTQHLRNAQGNTTSKVDLIPQTRAAFEASGRPYVIENVPGSPLRQDLLLCGSMFDDLRVTDATGVRWLQRHRIFESNIPLAAPRSCDHKGAGVRPLGVYAAKSDNIPSGGQTARSLDEGRALMGIHWMSWAALVEAIPPAYTHHIGVQLMNALEMPVAVNG